MEYEKIKQLMDDMGNSKITSLDIEFPDGIKIKMEKKNEVQVVSTQEVVSTAQDEKAMVTSNVETEVKSPLASTAQSGEIVKSPMIGTFYSKPSPTSNPYVEVGTQVKKGDVLCIIEAMKLMNEIESEYDGKIAEVFIKDGEPVDYGKPLFRIV